MFKYYNLYLNNKINDDEDDNLFKIKLNKSSKEVIDVKIIGELYNDKMYDLVTGKELLYFYGDKSLISNLSFYKYEELSKKDVVTELKKLDNISRIEMYYSKIEAIEDNVINLYNENNYNNKFISDFKKRYRRK